MTPKPSSSTAAQTDPIAKLENTLLSAPFDPNPLLSLLALARNPSPEIVHKAVWALHRVFIRFIDDGRVGTITGFRSGRNHETVDGEDDVRGWVRERMMDFLEILGGLMRDPEIALGNSALPLLFSLLPPLSSSISQFGQQTIHTPYFRIILNYLLDPPPSLRGADADTSLMPDNQGEGVLPLDVLKMAYEEYWAKYDDLRWAFFREAVHALRDGTTSLKHPENLLGQLLPLTNLPRLQEDLNTFFIHSLAEPPSTIGSKKLKKLESTKNGKKKKRKVDEDVDKLPDWMATFDSDSSSSDTTNVTEKAGKRPRARTNQLSIHASIHSIPSHQSRYTDLWEAVFSTVPLDEQWTPKILVRLHGETGILGHMKPERRVRVADWLGGLVDRGGANALLAMNGLFVLMTQFNLDYPNFYEKLYTLLDRNVLHVKYRARFFRLLDTFLTSTLLPAALIASFIKRLARLTLTAPPAGIIMVIPFIYNLLKRHPGCMVMIQRHGDDDGSPHTDPYRETDPSPLTSRAIESSLWELAPVRNHYLASISTLARIFEEVFTKPEYNLEDFLDHGYATLFETEINRKLKYPPALAIPLDIPDGSVGNAFPTKAAAAEVRGDVDLVGRLWSF